MGKSNFAIEPDSLEQEAEHLHDALAIAGLLDDIDNDDGLVFPLPENAEITRILAGYDARRGECKKVRCSACKQHQPHYRGFRVELSSGEHARIGVDCGERYFGPGTWQSAVADYDRRAENALYVSRIEPAISSIHNCMPIIAEWHKRTSIFGSWIVSFQREVPQLFGRLAQEAKRSEGRLERQRRVRKNTANKQGETGQKSVYETVVVGRIPYPDMFLGDSPNHGLNAAKNNFGLAIALLENKRDTASLAKAFGYIKEARQQIREAADVHRRIQSNLRLDWLPAVCDWANRDESLEFDYRAAPTGLSHDEDGFEMAFDFIDQATFGLPNLAEIDACW